MGVVGSSNRSDPYRSPPPQNYQYYEQARPQRRNRNNYNISGNVSEASVGPRIVVHGTPYIDRPSQYEVKQRMSDRTQKHSTPKPSHSGAEMCVREFGISAQQPQAPAEAPMFSTPRTPLRPPPQAIQPEPQQQQKATRNPIEPCNCKACRERDEKLAAYAGGPSAAATTTYVSPIEFTSTPTAPKRNACTTDNSCTGSSRGAHLPHTATYSTANCTAFDRSLNDTSRERNRSEHNEVSVERSGTKSFQYLDDTYGNTSTRMHQSSVEAQSPKYKDESFPVTSTRIHQDTISRESQAHKYRDETYADTSMRMHPITVQTQSSKSAQLCYTDRMTSR